MGRAFKGVAVVKAYSGDGRFICEDIVPLASFDHSGSLIMNVAQVRAARGIRFISLRRFDDEGRVAASMSRHYDLAGNETGGNYQRPDGSIIENVDWV